MNVSGPFIKRPIATTLLALAVMLGGWLGYWWLPVSSLPQVDFPTIQVTTQLPGANPETMGNLVTAPLERQLGQISALTSMTSSSSFGISQITLQFALDRDIDAAAQDVQAAINAAGSTLPRNLPYPPTYAKLNPADTPIITLALTSDTIPLRTLSDLADTLMGQRLASVTGVGHVAIQGGIKPAVRIQADLSRLSNYGLSMSDLRTAIAGANVSGPKGSLDGRYQSYAISANDQITTAEAYKAVIVAYRNNAPVLLKDVAQVVDGLENTKVGGWYQGAPAVVVDVFRQPGANVIETVQRVKAELPRIERSIPSGIKLAVVHDRTGTIRASVRDVQFTLCLSVVLVVLVVLIFLRSLRATMIAGVALPISLIATFGVMWMCGFSLDNLSLMALTIGTGFVVDDAIVMIENIVRHMEKGDSPMQAALKGAREIGFTVISLTLSLIAVFIPLLFMTGLVGRMFREFALTLTIAVVISAIVSLTLTPMMCSRMLRHDTGGRESRIARFFNATIEWVIRGYHRSLLWVLRHERATLLVSMATLVITIGLYVIVPKGFLPSQDTGLITAVIEAGPEVSFAEMERLQSKIVEVVRKDADVEGVVSVVGVSSLNPTPNAGHLKITLKPREERKAGVTAIIDRLQGAVSAVPGMVVFFQPVQDIQVSTRQSRSQYQYTLVSSSSEEVSLWSARLVEKLRMSPMMRDTVSEAQDGGLRAFVKVDRETAGRLGVSMQAINDALNDAFGQRQISTIYAQANQYRVVLEAMQQYQSDPSALSRVFVPSTNGAQVPLSAVAKIERRTAPLTIQHQDQFPSVTVSFNLAPGASSERCRLHHTHGAARDRHADVGHGNVLGRRGRVHALARWPALADPRRRHHHLYRARRALRELRPPLHHSHHPALGRHRRAARLDVRRHGFLVRGPDRHRAADGHREEERHHDDRLRAGCRANAGHVASGVHRAGKLAALPPDHDDDARCPVWRTPAGAGNGHRVGAQEPARRDHRRRTAAEPAAHALHHARDLPRHGAPARPAGAGCARDAA